MRAASSTPGGLGALKRRDDIAQIFGIHPGGECGRSHQVAEHHRQLAPLSLRRRGNRSRGDRRGRNRRRGDRLGGGQVALGRKGGRLPSMPQCRQWLRQRHGLGSGRTPIGRADEYLSVDIRRQPLDADQLATEFFQTVVVETEVESDTAIRDAALGDETPEDLFQYLIKVHASAPVRRDLRPWSRMVALAPKAQEPVSISSRPNNHLR